MTVFSESEFVVGWSVVGVRVVPRRTVVSCDSRFDNLWKPSTELETSTQVIETSLSCFMRTTSTRTIKQLQTSTHLGYCTVLLVNLSIGWSRGAMEWLELITDITSRELVRRCWKLLHPRSFGITVMLDCRPVCVCGGGGGGCLWVRESPTLY